MFHKTGCTVAPQLGFEPGSLVWRAGSLPIEPRGPASLFLNFLQNLLWNNFVTVRQIPQFLKKLFSNFSEFQVFFFLFLSFISFILFLLNSFELKKKNFLQISGGFLFWRL